MKEYSEAEAIEIRRELVRHDLFYLLRYECHREDMEHDFLFERCREVQESPDDNLDLWSREHYKSTIITFGKSIQDILSSHGKGPDPKWGGREVTIGIFSHNRPIAKRFLRQIKTEFEQNGDLKYLFPDVLYADPTKQSPKWSEDEGIVVKRVSNPGDATVEAWGLVDGQPISKHFFILNYDDVVTPASVTTPEMIQKTTDMLSLSYNLGVDGGLRRFIGTRYHYNDTYREVIKRGTAKPRIYAGTKDGTVTGEPYFWDKETLIQKRRDMGPYVFACQILQEPRADESQSLNEEWLRFYGSIKRTAYSRMVIYLLVDPANEKRKKSDYTSMWVVGLGPDGNYYALDIVRDRLSLPQRTNLLFRLHQKYRPHEVRYEEYGLQADISHIKSEMERRVYRFNIKEVGGTTGKIDRIKRLVPLFEQGLIWLPNSFHRTNYEGTVEDLVHIFVNDEYKAFPVPVHEDMLDALSRIAEPEMPLQWPQPESDEEPTVEPEVLDEVTGY